MAQEPLLSIKVLFNRPIIISIWFRLCGLTIFSFLEFQYASFGKEKDYHLFDLTTLVDGSDNLNGGHSLKNQLKSPL
jgi:hypothetical protein